MNTLDTQTNCYDGENPNNGRYYQASVIQDLLGDWLVVTQRGNKHWRKSVQRIYLCASYEEALKRLHKTKQIRQRHGYQPVITSINPHYVQTVREGI
jgi:hypothetical protein